jgi:CheY-like chemotaxis protein
VVISEKHLENTTAQFFSKLIYLKYKGKRIMIETLSWKNVKSFRKWAVSLNSLQQSDEINPVIMSNYLINRPVPWSCESTHIKTNDSLYDDLNCPQEVKNMTQHTLIMAVDDEPVVLLVLKRILENEGYEVVLANDGTSALALLDKHKPDLVLLDIMMPGLDGFHVLESIRERFDIPVIMLTARCDQESLVNTLKTGADDYIRKPFHTQILLARIRAKLRRAELLTRQN